MAESKQLVKLIKQENGLYYIQSKRGKSDYILLKYNRLDSDDTTKVHKSGNFASKFDEESKKLLKGDGGNVVITITQEGDFWNLTKVEPESSFKPKEKKPWNAGSKSFSGEGKTYNEAGVKVGAVLHDAVALAGKGATIEQVSSLAEKLLYLSYTLEQNVNSGKYKAPVTQQDSQDLEPPDDGPDAEDW